MRLFTLVLLAILITVEAWAQAPANATYIVQTPDATLTNEQALSALATCILKSTTGTGVVSCATASDFTSGTLALALGGTGSNLSGTGGSNQFLKQSTLGGAVTVGAIGLSDITEKMAIANLTDVTGKKGNSTTVQMFTGSTAPNDCAKFDVSGNLVTAGGACGLGAPNLTAMTDFQVQRTSTTVLTIGAFCSSSVPCNARIGNTTYSITASATATISAGSGTAYIYVTEGGTLTVGHNMTVACAGSCTASSPVTAFPAGAVPLWTWTSTSGTWDSGGGSEKRAYLGNKALAAGAGVSISDSAGIATISANPGTLNSTTWGDGTLSSFTWTFNVSGTDTVMTFSSNTIGVTTGNFQSSVYLSGAADPADAGVIRLGNAETIAWEASPAGTDVTLTVDASEIMQASGAFNAATLTEATNAVPNSTDNLSFFASTTSAQLAGVISNETGSGLLVFDTAPTITNVNLGTGVNTNGSGFKHQNVTTGSIALSSSAAVTLTWSSAFADASYTPICIVLEATTGTDTLRVHHIESFTGAAVVVRVVNDSGASARTGTLYCQAAHN